MRTFTVSRRQNDDADKLYRIWNPKEEAATMANRVFINGHRIALGAGTSLDVRADELELQANDAHLG